jgi:hypothetical protein
MLAWSLPKLALDRAETILLAPQTAHGNRENLTGASIPIKRVGFHAAHATISFASERSGAGRPSPQLF